MNNNDNDLKPLKLEQPYSIIYPSGKSGDGDKLKAWETVSRPKLTKQNLEDAWQAEDAFYKGPERTHYPSPMNAPEGDSNDYFLKGKNRIVGNRNVSQLGNFLNNFHGMDYFRNAVPKVEEGLKGTGYDMGPSANIVDNLKEAVDEGDTEEVENIIEEHPEESKEALPEDTPIQEEAEQITEDNVPQNDEVNNEVVEDFVEENKVEDDKGEDDTGRFKDIESKPYYDDWVNSEPGSEQFWNAYNSVVNDYGKEEADQQLKDWGIDVEDKGDDEVEADEFEAYAKQAGEEAGDKERLKREQKRDFETKLERNNQQAWKDYALEKSKLKRNGDAVKGFEKEVGKSILAEIMTPEEWMNDSLREGVLRNTTYTSDSTTMRNKLKESIAKEKKALGIDEETLKAKEDEEKKRKEEERKRREEAWAKFDKANGINQDKGVADKKKTAGSSFLNVPEDKSIPLVSGYKREDGKLLDEYGNEIPDYEHIDTEGGVLLHRDEDFAGPDEYVDEATGEIRSLEDRQFPALNPQDYHKDLAENGERGLETTDDIAYTVEGESDFEPTIYTIEDLDREIEEAEQMPVTNAEEAKAKQNRLKALRAKRVEYGNASSSDTNWDYSDRSTTTGGRVSPRAGIGSIGGAAGHGSMAATRPTKMAGDSHNSIASKAPLPHALEDNQGRVVSVNGKATTAPSSNNNGAFRSGSFGLMSKAKSNLKPVPSKAPVSGGAEHTGTPMAGAGKGMPGELKLEDGKQILIERLKQLLAQLTDEEKREMGFSPALNQWNGKALTRLDGYTLQDLIDKVEEYLGKEGKE